MAGNYGEIQIGAGSIEEALLKRQDVMVRLEALAPGRGKQLGDSGTVAEAVKEYELEQRLMIEQLKSLVRATEQFLQKADTTFTEADRKSARGME